MASKGNPDFAEFRKRRDAMYGAVEKAWKFPDQSAAAKRDADVLAAADRKRAKDARDARAPETERLHRRLDKSVHDEANAAGRDRAPISLPWAKKVRPSIGNRLRLSEENWPSEHEIVRAAIRLRSA